MIESYNCEESKDAQPDQVQRTQTAIFGSKDEMLGVEKPTSDSTEGPKETKKKCSNDDILKCLAAKKTRMFFYSTRQISLFANGSFGYKNLKSNTFKLYIKAG